MDLVQMMGKIGGLEAGFDWRELVLGGPDDAAAAVAQRELEGVVAVGDAIADLWKLVDQRSMAFLACKVAGQTGETRETEERGNVGLAEEIEIDGLDRKSGEVSEAVAMALSVHVMKAAGQACVGRLKQTYYVHDHMAQAALGVLAVVRRAD
jgi:hypothetical protein